MIMISFMLCLLFISSITLITSKRLQQNNHIYNNNKIVILADESNAASVQYMITRRMRKVLEEELSYLPEEVDVMLPQVAKVVIERGLSRPLKGMPESWRRDDDVSSEDGSINSDALINKMKFIIKKLFIPAAGVLIYTGLNTSKIISIEIIKSFINKKMDAIKTIKINSSNSNDNDEKMIEKSSSGTSSSNSSKSTSSSSSSSGSKLPPSSKAKKSKKTNDPSLNPRSLGRVRRKLF